ncbi:MAG: hypothetical protein BIFFINMI_02790 [Phycisphaerae bacterium]|nr:hypothetical protein [Phycisphaerae bacterium]
MSCQRSKKRMGFSLLELMLVVVIIALIAAIAIPRLSRGTEGATSSSLAGSLAVLRDGIDRYSVEHGGSFPTVASFSAQMTQYSDASGNTSATKDATHVYGPYVRSVPPQPVGPRAGQSGVAAADGATVGWLYNASTGNITANCTTETDATGKLYVNY